jgi:3-hydroxyisobutyrate dehydrogenase-like beta-hydroxyacid dehydrogenase
MIKPSIGFIGIGIMGAPMAANLARAGYNLTIYDINRESAGKVVSSCPGMVAANSPKEVAQASNIVITMLPSGKYVQESVFGPSGLIEGFKSGAMLIDTSSSEPWLTIETARKLNTRGVAMVDAPVSGAQRGAQEAELVFMVGGEQASVDSAFPILKTMGKQVFHLGPIGAGHAMKCINNLITAITFMATAEGLALGKQFDLDPNVMTDVLNVSTGMSWISRTHIKQRIINRKFDDAFKLQLMVKDIGIAMNLADQIRTPLPLSALGYHLWQASAKYAEKGSSISKMVSWVEHVTGVEITAE